MIDEVSQRAFVSFFLWEIVTCCQDYDQVILLAEACGSVLLLRSIAAFRKFFADRSISEIDNFAKLLAESPACISN